MKISVAVHFETTVDGATAKSSVAAEISDDTKDSAFDHVHAFEQLIETARQAARPQTEN